MAIHGIIKKEEFEAAGGVNVVAKNYDGEDVYYRASHHGLVLACGESYLWDGEFTYYALVWNPENGKPEQIHTGDTRALRNGYAVVDATPEVLAAYKAYQARIEAERLERARAEREKDIRESCEARAKAPAKGTRVRVVKGRKVPNGTEGECFWVGETQYGTRIGIRDDAGTVHWTAATNAVALDWETVLPRLLAKAGL
jgi:hypothetical protein